MTIFLGFMKKKCIVMVFRKAKIYRQIESKDCGPTCLKIIASHFGKTVNTQYLREISETTREGSNLLTLSILYIQF